MGGLDVGSVSDKLNFSHPNFSGSVGAKSASSATSRHISDRNSIGSLSHRLEYQSHLLRGAAGAIRDSSASHSNLAPPQHPSQTSQPPGLQLAASSFSSSRIDSTSTFLNPHPSSLQAIGGDFFSAHSDAHTHNNDLSQTPGSVNTDHSDQGPGYARVGNFSFGDTSGATSRISSRSSTNLYSSNSNGAISYDSPREENEQDWSLTEFLKRRSTN